MDLNLSVFQEPRGVMRILHFIFSICAFATITGYSGFVKISCLNGHQEKDEFSYPFVIQITKSIPMTPSPTPIAPSPTPPATCNVTILGDFSSDAKFFVATGVLAMLYAIAALAIYTKLDEMYKRNSKLPLYDFLITVVFGVLWLSSSAAWANGLTGIKSETNPTLEACSNCTVTSSNFSTLNISVIFGFLNFFLWAADLWFIYKETSWFLGNQRQDADGV